VRIINNTRGQVIAGDAKKVTSIRDQLLGLLDPTNPRTLIFCSRFGIHTFFMKDSIDVMVLDDKQKVVKIKKNLHPNSIFIYPLRYTMVIECPSGSLQKTQIGDLIELKDQ
jgi:hypothetical protein